jgi:integron integrase
MMGVMIGKDASGNIKVTFPYDPVYVARVKTIPGRKWHPDGKYWTFPYSKTVFNQIHSAFAGEDFDIDESLKSLAPHTQVEKPAGATVLDRFHDLIRLKHYSTRTEETYLHWITRYLSFHNNRDPKEMGAQEIEAFLSHLAVDLKVAAGTQNGAFNAILFLYRDVLRKELPEPINAIRAKKPQRLPTVMSKNEVLKVVAAIPPEHQLMVKLIYGSGLRLMECLRLRVKDVDFANNQLLVRDAKGVKDRVTVLPDNLKEALHEHLERVRLMHQNDVAKGYGRVYLPYALARKYPKASLEWAW